jgi:hypothetical protein
VLEFNFRKEIKMNKYATLNGVVVLVEPTQEQLQELVFLQDYDTVIVLEAELSVGDELPSTSQTPAVEQLTMSKLRAFYSLASFGLLSKADTEARRNGSVKLYEVWINESNKLDGVWTVRKCAETVELMGLMGMSSAQMDAVFERGATIDINNPKANFDEESSRLFDIEMRIMDCKRHLKESDYVELPSYDKDSSDLVAQRQAWREEIRALEAELGIE